MMSKPLAVFLTAATVVGAVMVGAHQMRGTNGDALTGARASSSAPGAAPRISHSLSPQAAQPANAGPTATALAPRDPRVTDGNNVGTPGGPTRTRGGTGHRQERAKNGSYVTILAGSYNGTGMADVKDDKVSIRADVLTSDGRSGRFVANNLMFDGPYFHGLGTIMGETVQVNGRLDAARASRLTATFTLSDGRAARVVGNLPAAIDAGDDNWDEEGPTVRTPK
ncbi:MAG: hypothetical protein H7Z14_07985 [Anaerolineae bacterium]|nr:hypothetical protein [Phycisphaerae bacterium]